MFHIAASSRWPRSVRVTHRYVEYVTRAEMNCVCSTSISCSDRDNYSRNILYIRVCSRESCIHAHSPENAKGNLWLNAFTYELMSWIGAGMHGIVRENRKPPKLCARTPHTLLFIPASFVFRTHRRSLQCRLCVLWFCPISVAAPCSFYKCCHLCCSSVDEPVSLPAVVVFFVFIPWTMKRHLCSSLHTYVPCKHGRNTNPFFPATTSSFPPSIPWRSFPSIQPPSTLFSTHTRTQTASCAPEQTVAYVWPQRSLHLFLYVTSSCPQNLASPPSVVLPNSC